MPGHSDLPDHMWGMEPEVLRSRKAGEPGPLWKGPQLAPGVCLGVSHLSHGPSSRLRLLPVESGVPSLGV